MRKRAAIVAASPTTVSAFLRGHITLLSQRWDVTVFVNTADVAAQEAMFPLARVTAVPIARQISPGVDARCLLNLARAFRSKRLDVVFSVTPKAGLLAMMAGSLARVPVRVHMFTGQVWVTRKGLVRTMLKAADRLIAACATDVLTDSDSQRLFLVAEGVVRASRLQVLAKGSICGVDSTRFRPDGYARRSIRRELGLADAATVLLFIGRLNRDKGVLDLARATQTLIARERQDIHLLIVGPDEGRLRPALREMLGDHPGRLHLVESTDKPEWYMAAADVLCLPSYREGFGSVVIEAAAVGIPSVASRIYGLTDAVEDRVTGLLHPPGDIEGMVACLSALLEDESRRRAMGEAARRRAARDFSHEAVTAAFVRYMRERLGDAEEPA